MDSNVGGHFLASAALLLLAGAAAMPAQPKATDYGGTPIEEIVLRNEDGVIRLREVQFIGRGIPQFKAKIINGMSHDWQAPSFSVVYEGHDLDDPSKQIRQSFTVTGTFCGWPKGGTCAISQDLDFPLFYIENYEIKLTGGIKRPTDAEKEDQARIAAIEAERRAAEDKAAAERRRKAEAEDEAEQRKAKAIEEEKQRELRVACAVVYRSTANRKVSDLTVKEEQQVRSCQVLNLYPPR